MTHIHSRSLDRRTFLKVSAGAALAASIPERLVADPYRPLGVRPAAGRPVRVRGVVRSAGAGLNGIAVSDGYDVVDTGPTGVFELVTRADRPFVHVSVPAGYRVPTNPTGTARFYAPIDPNRDETEVQFDLEPLDRSDERHTLILLGDIQAQDRQETAWFRQRSVPDIRATVAALGDREAFGIACGDIMYDNLELYPEYEAGVRDIGIPFYQVIGNHDLDQENPTDEASTRTFSRHFGPRYYSFDRGAVHYVVLDDVFWHGAGYIGYLDDDQLTWLARDLARVEPGRPVIVATHIPVVGSRYERDGDESPGAGVAITNRQALYRLLEPYQAHVLTGHTHECEHVFEGGVHEHVTGAVCGAWWSGPICWDGTPNGYCVYDVDGESVRWRYKGTGMPDDEQLRIYAPGADPASPGELIANVWNADPEWTVTWYAEGGERGVLSQRVGLDPWSVELHTGDALPERRPWVDPIRTGHLYYGRLPTSPGRVTVEVTDRFGRTYSDSISL